MESIAQDEVEVKQDTDEYLFGDPEECGCVLPEQHCPVCEAAAREVNGDGNDELPF